MEIIDDEDYEYSSKIVLTLGRVLNLQSPIRRQAVIDGLMDIILRYTTHQQQILSWFCKIVVDFDNFALFQQPLHLPDTIQAASYSISKLSLQIISNEELKTVVYKIISNINQTRSSQLSLQMNFFVYRNFLVLKNIQMVLQNQGIQNNELRIEIERCLQNFQFQLADLF